MVPDTSVVAPVVEPSWGIRVVLLPTAPGAITASWAAMYLALLVLLGSLVSTRLSWWLKETSQLKLLNLPVRPATSPRFRSTPLVT